jgi:hypothetical protein
VTLREPERWTSLTHGGGGTAPDEPQNPRSEGGDVSEGLISYPVKTHTGYRDPQNPDALHRA